MTRDRALACALFSVGLTAIVGQILLMRELVATLYGNELLIGLILAAWLGWGAAGAALAAARRSGRTRHLAAGLAAAALLLPAQLTFVRALRTLLGATPGSMLDLGPLVAAVVLVLAPLCLCLGALFSIGARMAVEAARTPGWAYAWDAIGSAAGGVLFSFVLIRWLNPFQTAFLVAGLDLAVALLLAPHPAREGERPAEAATPQRSLGLEPSGGLMREGDRPAEASTPQRALGLEPSGGLMREGDRPAKASTPQRALGLEPSGGLMREGDRPAKASSPGGVIFRAGTAAAIGVLVITVAAAVPLGRAAQAATLRLEWPEPSSGTAQSLLFSGDSPYGRLAVQARGSQRIFYTDGVLAFETQSTFPEEVAHLALLAHPAPRDVLLIGGGIAGDLREILKHPVDTVTYVELDPLLIETARRYLPAADAAILDDPRVRLAQTDGRAFVGLASGSYDAIILDLPEPTTGALNRFYTIEFFAQARRLLRPGGILSFGLPSAENYWNPELTRRNASIYRTLEAVFPSVTVLPGEHGFFLAGDGAVDADAGVMSERLAQRGIRTRWVTPAYLRDLLAGDRFAEAQARVKGEAGVRTNRDLFPLSYSYSLSLWLARIAPQASRIFEAATPVEPWWLALPLALAVALTRRRRRWAVVLVVACIGMGQMLLELVLLFTFQALHGSLYGAVSLIVTAFMAGLALGGAAGNRLLAGSDVKRKTQNVKRALAATLAVMGVYSIALPLLFSAPLRAQGIPQPVFPLLALIGGLLGGMVFPLASRLAIADSTPSSEQPSAIRHQPSAIRNPQSAIGGRLYAADLAGGCLGALLGTALFIPILGIPQSCAAIAALAIAGLLVLL